MREGMKASIPVFTPAVAALTLLTVAPAPAASPPASESASGMVVSSQHDASDVGAEVLRKGGNAIDAAVAVDYALAVTHPCCGTIGGGGFMLIHLADGRNEFINFRERAPLAASADMSLDAKGNAVPDRGVTGWLGVGTPGTVLEILVAVIDHQVPLQEAVDAPRYHHQWLPDTLQAEPGALTPQVAAALEAMGHKVVPLEVWTAGNSAAVIGVSPHDPALARALGFPLTDVLLGANDIRTPAGSAAAP